MSKTFKDLQPGDNVYVIFHDRNDLNLSIVTNTINCVTENDDNRIFVCENTFRFLVSDSEYDNVWFNRASVFRLYTNREDAENYRKLALHREIKSTREHIERLTKKLEILVNAYHTA